LAAVKIKAAYAAASLQWPLPPPARHTLKMALMGGLVFALQRVDTPVRWDFSIGW